MNRKPRILVGPKLNSSDQLLMTLMHWREYRAQLRIAQTYGVSESHVSRTVRKVAPIEAQIETALTTAAVVHVDETGLRVKSHLHWLHGAGNERLTYYALDAQRGRSAQDRIGLLPAFARIAVHDALRLLFDDQPVPLLLC